MRTTRPHRASPGPSVRHRVKQLPRTRTGEVSHETQRIRSVDSRQPGARPGRLLVGRGRDHRRAIVGPVGGPARDPECAAGRHPGARCGDLRRQRGGLRGGRRLGRQGDRQDRLGGDVLHAQGHRPHARPALRPRGSQQGHREARVHGRGLHANGGDPQGGDRRVRGEGAVLHGDRGVRRRDGRALPHPADPRCV